MTVFIDSKIPIDVACREHPLREPAKRFLERVRSDKSEACTSTEVLQEILYRYAGLGRLDLAGAVYDSFVEICPEVLPITLAETDIARQLVVDGIAARGALHAAVMLNNEIRSVATFDAGFDRITGIERLRL